MARHSSAEYQRAWRKANPDKVNASRRRYVERHREQVNARARVVHSKRKEERRNTSLCQHVYCKQLAVEGRSGCEIHLKQWGQQARRQYVKRRAQGLCTFFGCTEKAEKNRTQCKAHLDRMNQKNRDRHRDRISQGLCTQCSAVSPFGRLCINCSAPHRQDPLPQKLRSAINRARQAEEAQARDAKFRERQAEIRSQLDLLPERLRQIIEMRWLGENKRTLQSVGDELGLTRERIRQLEAEAFSVIELTKREQLAA